MTGQVWPVFFFIKKCVEKQWNDPVAGPAIGIKKQIVKPPGL